MVKGEEYALMGRRMEEPPPDPPGKKRRGRPCKVKPSPDAIAATAQLLKVCKTGI